MAGRFDNIFSQGATTSPTGLPSISTKGKFDNIFAPKKVVTTQIQQKTITPSKLATFASQSPTLNIIADLQTNPLSLPKTYGANLATDPAKAAFEVFKSAGQQDLQAAAEFVNSFQSKRSWSEKLGKLGKLFGASAGLVFSPLTAIFEGANKIPVLGSVSKLITLPIAGLGEGGENTAELAVNALPISQQHKDNIMEGAKSIGSLAGMLAGGAIGERMIGRPLTGKPKTIIDEVKTDLIKEKIPTEKVDILTQKQVDSIVAKHSPQDAKTIIKEAVKVAETKRIQDVIPPQTTETTPSGVPIRVVSAPEPIKPTPKATGIKAEVESPLLQEARKYKTAEEFVKAQGETLYHGGTPIKEVGNMRGNWKAFYMSEDPTYAKSYGGSKSVLNEMVLSKDAKIADLRKPSEGLVSQLDQMTGGRTTGKTFNVRKPDGSYVGIPEIIDRADFGSYTQKQVIDGIRQGKAHFAEEPAIKEALRKLGYDGMITQESKFGANYGVWNKNVIKTKSQLTDIWKEANKVKEAPKEVPSGITEPPKPVESKSNETFKSRVFERMQQEYPDIFTGDLEVEKLNMKKDFTRAVDLIAKDKQEAYNRAMGMAESPDINPNSINIALSEKAILEGNNVLAERLVRARSLQLSRYGQTLATERGSVTDNSAQRYMKELLASKLDRLGRNYLGDIKNRLTRSSNKEKAISKIDKEVSDLTQKVKTKKVDTRTILALLDKVTCV